MVNIGIEKINVYGCSLYMNQEELALAKERVEVFGGGKVATLNDYRARALGTKDESPGSGAPA